MTSFDKLKIVVASVGVGAGFGFLLDKAGVSDPVTIIAQFRMESFVMMKTFLGAVCMSMFVHGTLHLISNTRHKFEVVRNASIFPRSTLMTALGAGLLGCGMAISGSCPGTVAAQLGNGKGLASFGILGGGLLAAVAFGFLEPRMRSTLKGNQSNKDLGVDTKTGIPYWKLAYGLGAAIGLGVLAMEYAMPWKAGARLTDSIPFLAPSGTFSPRAKLWPPIICGLGIGALQVPAILFIKKTIGSSSSYVTLTSNALACVCPEVVKKNSYFMSKKDGLQQNWWQVLYLLGAVGGAYVSSTLSGTFGATEAGISVGAGAVGGFVMVFGARMAGGCTSGHGISGFSHLAVLSFVSVAAMFAGAIGTAQFVKYVL
eukprot:CAMPEP_0174252734 /NCGR_PEP_ID=MMETSP0439-20130205/2101_1 /TAXON_ID=0 /ORGANISM="Stereomyxa ramosa, Strain Chinc5" /LENGTH=370 /DNA_ID=CAMNT_0015333331 /DNA_START=77 /DNA_END=1189 /DNA_ORIENTATION=-